MKKNDVFCYGEIGIDNIIEADQLPSPEVAVFPKSESYHAGGAAANTGIWLAQMGLQVGLSGNVIGNDQYGKLLIKRLKEHPEIDLQLIDVRENIPTPYTRAIVTPDGERSFLIFYYPQTPKKPFDLDQLQGAKYLALDLYGGEERLQTAKTAYTSGVLTAIGDVVWTDHAVLPYTSIATNSGSYIRALFPGVDVRQYAHELQKISKGIIITTDGGKPIHTIDTDESEFFVSPPATKVKDATGAGDAFRAGLLYGLVKGKTLMDSVCLGAATGSLKVGHLGAATTLPDLSEILSLAETIKARKL
jgi:alpha-D-ribose-1-phosphate 5-kinase (ADP)